MRIKSLWLQTVMFCMVLLGHSAQASTQAYSVSATVTGIDQQELTAVFSLGSALTGKFVLDDTMSNASPFPNSSWYLGSVTEAHFTTGSISVDVLGGYTGVQNSIGSIAFAAGPLFGVGGTIGGNNSVNDWSLSGWSLMLTDTAHIISSNKFPEASLLTNSGLYRQMYLTYTNQAGEYAHVVADVSAINLISAVPEPSSVLMMAAGMLVLLLTRRKPQE